MENNEEMTIKTVKGFDSNLKCRNLQYEVGKTYEIPEGEKIGLCENGFHAVDGDVSPLVIVVEMARNLYIAKEKELKQMVASGKPSHEIVDNYGHDFEEMLKIVKK